MTTRRHFRRSALLALAWCLVGLGIDLGADSRGERRDQRPTTSEYTRAQRAPWDHNPPSRTKRAAESHSTERR